MMAERRFPRTLSLFGVVFIVVLHAVFWWLEFHPTARGLNGDEVYYWQTAQQLAAGEEPSWILLWPPLYAHFLAALNKISPGLLIVGLAQGLLLILIAWLLARITRSLGADPRIAVLVAMMVVAYPPLIGFSHYLWSEVLHLALWSGALWIILTRRHTLGWAAILGCVLGMALLTKSLLTPFVPVLLLPLALGVESRPRRSLRVAVAALALFVTVAPTIFKHHRQTGLWVIANSGALNIWVGLNDRSRKNFVDPVINGEYVTYLESSDTWAERDRILWRKIRNVLAERDLGALVGGQLSRQYFRLFHKDSFLTDQLPGGELNGPKRGYQHPPPWLAQLIRWLSYGFYGALLVMASWGFWVYPPSRGRGAWLLIAFLIYNLGLFFWLHVKSRFRIQLLPVFFVYAGLAVEGWWLRRPAAYGRWRVVLAVGSSLLLLWLAFSV